MGRIIILLAIVLLVLAIILIARAIRASRASHDEEVGYQVLKFDRLGRYDGELETVIMIKRANLKGRVEAVIPLSDPTYSDRVIEEHARAVAKADDWNTTNRALRP